MLIVRVEKSSSIIRYSLILITKIHFGGYLMKLTKVLRYLAIIICISSLLISLTGCEMMSSQLKDLKGELVGNRFAINLYDNFGNNVLTMEGEKVGIEANYVKTYSVDKEGNKTTNSELSSVITITIDGNQLAETGNTAIFAEEGLQKLKDFSLPDHITTNGGGTLNIFDRDINKIKNMIGTPKVVVICSQLGIPLAVYGGESVYWEIPSDLPKTTKLSIDGRALYIHRANYILLDSDLIK